MVVARTILFAAVAVGLTMVLGALVALLLRNLGRPMRVLVTAGLVAAWAMPTLTAISIWQWLFDFEFGVVNWLLTRLRAESFEQHNWFDQPLQGFTVILIVVVWGALPFVAITLHAGLTQVPTGLRRPGSTAPAPGGCSARHPPGDEADLPDPGHPLHHLGLQGLHPDLGAAQPAAEPRVLPARDLVLQRVVRGHPLRQGAAIAVVMVVLLLLMTAFYVRQMLRAVGP